MSKVYRYLVTYIFAFFLVYTSSYGLSVPSTPKPNIKQAFKMIGITKNNSSKLNQSVKIPRVKGMKTPSGKLSDRTKKKAIGTMIVEGANKVLKMPKWVPKIPLSIAGIPWEDVKKPQAGATTDPRSLIAKSKF